MYMEKRRENKLIIILSILLILFGIGTLLYSFKDDFKTKVKEKNALEEFYKNEETEEIVNTTIEPDIKTDLYQYVAVLKIPKINLEKGIVGKNSIFNSVNYGIEMIGESDYPDVTNGDVILAAHNGSSSISFFRNLYKLERGDEAHLDYNYKTYKYKLVNIYDIEKNGKALIKSNKLKSNLILVTCKGNTNYQSIYIFELVK